MSKPIENPSLSEAMNIVQNVCAEFQGKLVDHHNIQTSLRVVFAAAQAYEESKINKVTPPEPIEKN